LRRNWVGLAAESKREDCALRDIWHLHTVDWLEQLSGEETRKLRGASVVRTYAPGEMIFAPELNPGSLYLLATGIVRIYRVSSDGAETAFGYVAAGEVFGELALFDDFNRESFAEAVRSSQVWKIPRNLFSELVENSPGLVLAITRQIGSRFKRIESRIENLVFRDARSRVAGILCELAEDFGREVEQGLLIDIDLTQAELATLVGITRQTANVYLRELQDQGILSRSRRLITVLESGRLKQVAAGSPASDSDASVTP